MAAQTESLVVSISEKGALVVKRNIDGIGKGAQKAEGGVGILRKALGALGAALAIRQVIGLADAYTDLQNRLKLVTNGADQLASVTNELFAISERTRSSFGATGEMYARVALAAQDLGRSQAEILQFTESLNQAITLSGASAAEAQAGMIQLSQGLASGALRGDELRSVLEQLPAVADVIADSMGITRGELRNMGQEGKITAEIVLDAFKGAREELAEKFAKTVPTVGQSIVVLKNSFLGLVGGVSSASGATSGLAQAILDVAKLVPKLQEPLLVFADTVVATFSAFGDLFGSAGQALEGMGSSWTEVFENIGLALLALLRTATQVIDKIVGSVLGLAGFIMEGGRSLLQGDFKNMGATASAAFQEGFNQTALTDIFDNVVDKVQGAAAKRGAEMAMGANIPAPLLPAAPVIPTAPAEDLRTKIDPNAGYDEYLANLKREVELLGMSNEERRVQQAFDAARKTLLEGQDLSAGRKEEIRTLVEQEQAIEAVNAAEAQRAALIAQLQGPQAAYNAEIQMLNEIMAQYPELAAAAIERIEDLNAKMTEVEETSNILKDGAFASLWDNASSALDNFVDTGIFKFKDFARSVISDITKIAGKMALLAAFRAMGIPIPGFATGGSFMVGGQGGTDNNLVAFNASRGERVDVLTPSQQAAQAQGQTVAGNTSVGVTIINVVDPSEIPAIMASEAGQNATLNTISLNGNTVRQAIS